MTMKRGCITTGIGITIQVWADMYRQIPSVCVAVLIYTVTAEIRFPHRTRSDCHAKSAVLAHSPQVGRARGTTRVLMPGAIQRFERERWWRMGPQGRAILSLRLRRLKRATAPGLQCLARYKSPPILNGALGQG